MKMKKIEPLGDQAILVVFGEQISTEATEKVAAFSRMIEENPIPGLIELVPAYTTVTIHYDPSFFQSSDHLPYHHIKSKIETLLSNKKINELEGSKRLIEIPVCYGGMYGPDLHTVAKINHLTEDEVISIHKNKIYTVSLIGFAPGFPYLSGLNKRIATPRLSTPRKNVAVGSVGIAKDQTGIYSVPSPGGWQIIGRTPITLFDPANSVEPSYLRQGDQVKFFSINETAFENWGKSS